MAEGGRGGGRCGKKNNEGRESIHGSDSGVMISKRRAHIMICQLIASSRLRVQYIYYEYVLLYERSSDTNTMILL